MLAGALLPRVVTTHSKRPAAGSLLGRPHPLLSHWLCHIIARNCPPKPATHEWSVLSGRGGWSVLRQDAGQDKRTVARGL